MEAEDPPPPSKIARHALYGTGSSSGLRRSIDKYVGLRLELGRSSSSSKASSSSGFSFLQLQELELQALIYAYMEAGLSVPHHLLLPIWKSVATSFTAQLNSGSPLLHQQSPNQLAGLSWLCEEYKKSTQAAEAAGRCRRTDGKKWRCSKDVVPNHKYCDRHIHRGRRHRSSKQCRQQAQT